jgi:excisionase family DNA binding protein
MSEHPNTIQPAPEPKSNGVLKTIRRTETRLELIDPARAKEIRISPPIVMSINEGACYLGVSPRKLRDDIKSRRIASAPFGGRILIRRADLDAAIESRILKAV